MKGWFFLLFPFSLFSQTTMEGPWTLECGASSNSRYKERSILNLRYISPRFRWTQSEWTAEEETHPEDFKKTRIMFELLYGPPTKIFAMGANVQHRILKYKKLSIEAYGGVKFFFVSTEDMTLNTRGSRQNKDAWYINAALLIQVDLGLFSPFVDIGRDVIYTLGVEIDLPGIRKKVKRRFRAPYLKQ
ncbi:MAG: hypothetical protein JNL60_12485 [Bacteroidia bacterium]|nr:hypothetical protein [Bacteroidia bacterium]